MEGLLQTLIIIFSIGLTFFALDLFIRKKLPAINTGAIAFVAGILLVFYFIIGYVFLLALYLNSSGGITFSNFFWHFPLSKPFDF